MMHLRTGFLALAALVGAALISIPGSAMPVGGLKAAAEDLSNTENVYWVCRRYHRCYGVGARYYGPYYPPVYWPYYNSIYSLDYRRSWWW
jgi:hypothetical protein